MELIRINDNEDINSLLAAIEENIRTSSIMRKEIEKHHSHRFELLAEEIKGESVFKKPEITQWVCSKCGHIHIGKEAPCKCSVCDHPQGYFELFVEKF